MGNEDVFAKLLQGFDDIDIDVNDSENKADRETAPPPPTYLGTILPSLTEEERDKILHLFDCSDTPTAIVPKTDNPDTGNFSIPPHRPISDSHALGIDRMVIDAASADDSTVETSQNELLDLFEEEEKADIRAACDFLKAFEFDTDSLINTLCTYEFDESPLVLEEISAVLNFLLRNLLILFLHLLKGNQIPPISSHKLVKLAENSLTKISEQPTGAIDAEILINRLEVILNQLMSRKIDKRQRSIYQQFLTEL